MTLNFKPIVESDLKIIKEIYDYYILNTTVTFHTKPVEIEDVRKNHPVNHEKYKTFLMDTDGETVGYCSFGQYKNKEAYDRTAEICIYLKPEKTGNGIGPQAVRHIEKIAKENEIKVLIAFITSENKISVKLFERLGYNQCAHFKNVGEKFNRVLDVLVYQKELGV